MASDISLGVPREGITERTKLIGKLIFANVSGQREERGGEEMGGEGMGELNQLKLSNKSGLPQGRLK